MHLQAAGSSEAELRRFGALNPNMLTVVRIPERLYTTTCQFTGLSCRHLRYFIPQNLRQRGSNRITSLHSENTELLKRLTNNVNHRQHIA